MPALKPYRKLASRRKQRYGEELEGEYFFSDQIADSPCEAALYIVPHQAEPMFKIGWCVAADRRLDKLNEIWGQQLDIYQAIVIATSRDEAIWAESRLKKDLGSQGWRVEGLPAGLEGNSEFFHIDGLLYVYDNCVQKLLPALRLLAEQSHMITAAGEAFTRDRIQYIVDHHAGKLVSPDRLIATMIEQGKLRLIDMPSVLGTLIWEAFPVAIIKALAAGHQRFSAYAAYADALWARFGQEILKHPSQFLEIADPSRHGRQKSLPALLEFIIARKVAIKDQSQAWLVAILSSLSASAAAELIVSHDIELRHLTFEQRASALRKLHGDKDQAALFEKIGHQLDDLEQLKAEMADLCALTTRCRDIELILNNPIYIERMRSPKHFPGVLARVYYAYFDGITDSATIKPVRWHDHVHVHIQTFQTALLGLKKSLDNHKHPRMPVPVFYRATLAAMLDLYGTGLDQVPAFKAEMMSKLADMGQRELAEYFDDDASSAFAFVRNEVRQVHSRLARSRVGGRSADKDFAPIQSSIQRLRSRLPRTEAGTYYVIYAFEDMVWEHGKLITSPANETLDQSRLMAIRCIKDLWGILRESIIHERHVFNYLLIYLHDWAACFEIEDVPQAHPDPVF